MEESLVLNGGKGTPGSEVAGPGAVNPQGRGSRREGVVNGFVTLDQQALFGPTPEWEAAAKQLQARERARPKGHAASTDGVGE
jgi:hypothetical protein